MRVSKEHTRNKDITVVGHEIFDDTFGAIRDIDVSPVHPRMLGLHRRVEQVVAGATNGLTTGPLGGERVTILDAHLDIGSEVLLHDGRAVESDLIALFLNPLQFRQQDLQGVILAVADEETQVDEMVRVADLVEQFEVFFQVVGGIPQGRQDENAFVVGDGLGTRVDSVQFDLADGGGVDFVRFVVVQEHGRLSVAVPFNHLIQRHFHGGLGGAVAVETRRRNESVSRSHSDGLSLSSIANRAGSQLEGSGVKRVPGDWGGRRASLPLHFRRRPANATPEQDHQAGQGDRHEKASSRYQEQHRPPWGQSRLGRLPRHTTLGKKHLRGREGIDERDEKSMGTDRTIDG